VSVIGPTLLSRLSREPVERITEVGVKRVLKYKKYLVSKEQPQKNNTNILYKKRSCFPKEEELFSTAISSLPH
jgi:hypothetical protein